MPELPEVETIARKLKQVLPGKTVSEITQFHPKSFIGDASLLLNQPILDVSRRAKILRLHFPQGLNILVHLKMTGQLIMVDGQTRVGGGHPTADWVSNLPSKHTRVTIRFSDGVELFFNDQRLFGWLKVQTDQEVQESFAVLAPDITDESVTDNYFQSKIKNRAQAIKQVIMDNAVVAGVGNIYACDALNLAQIHPQRPGKSLSEAEAKRLLAAMKEVITRGVELGGTTFDGKYVDIDGMAGEYQSVVRVYGRQGLACLHCGGTIAKIQLGGRGTYFCTVCQV